MVSHSHHGTHHAWLSYAAVILDQDTPLSQHAPSRLLLLPRRHKNGNVEKVVVVIKKPSNTKLVSREQGRPFFSWRRLHYIRFLPPNNPPSQCDPRSPSIVLARVRARPYALTRLSIGRLALATLSPDPHMLMTGMNPPCLSDNLARHPLNPEHMYWQHTLSFTMERQPTVYLFEPWTTAPSHGFHCNVRC